MAARKKEVEVLTDQTNQTPESDDISPELISQLNKELGERVAYNLGSDEVPATVKYWIPTGSYMLDYIISNRRNGGLPGGRVIEMAGMPSTGKTHIAISAAKSVQKMGGMTIFIESENAISIDKVQEMGLDVSKKFVYCDTHTTEEVFTILESVIEKSKKFVARNLPILAIWDSVAGTSPKAELEAEYSKDSMGLQARVLSKSMRKITGILGKNNVTLLCLNQLRSKVGVIFGDPLVTPGGWNLAA